MKERRKNLRERWRSGYGCRSPTEAEAAEDVDGMLEYPRRRSGSHRLSGRFAEVAVEGKGLGQEGDSATVHGKREGNMVMEAMVGVSQCVGCGHGSGAVVQAKEGGAPGVWR